MLGSPCSPCCDNCGWLPLSLTSANALGQQTTKLDLSPVSVPGIGQMTRLAQPPIILPGASLNAPSAPLEQQTGYTQLFQGFRGIAGGFSTVFNVGAYIEALGKSAPTVRGCRIRYVCGYDTDTGSHAFVEFEHEAAVQSGYVGRDGFGVSEYIQGINAGGQKSSDGIGIGPTFIGDYNLNYLRIKTYMVPGGRYDTPKDSEALQFFGDLSTSHATQVSTQRTDVSWFDGYLYPLNWRTQYIYTHVRVGFNLNGSDELLFVDRLPRATGFRFHIACAKGLFSVWLHDSSHEALVSCPISISQGLCDRNAGGVSSLSLAPSALTGSGAFGAAFELPQRIAAGTGCVGWSVLPATKTQPDWSNMSGVYYQGAPLPDLSSPHPAVTHSTTALTNPTTLFKLPCGDGFPGASNGFEGLSLVGVNANTTSVPCRLYVRDPDVGQFVSTRGQLNDFGYSDYLPTSGWPFTCADAPESIYVTLHTAETLTGVPGYVFNGKYKMDRITGTTAQYRVSINGLDYTSSGLANQNGLVFPLTRRLHDTACFIWAELMPGGLIRWVLRAALTETRTNFYGVFSVRVRFRNRNGMVLESDANFSSMPPAATEPLVREFSLT